MSKIEEGLNKKFGRLTVKEIIRERGKNTKYRCICECGNEITTQYNNLYIGKTLSCGCLENERLKKNQRLSPEERQHFHLDVDEIYEILIDYKSRCEKAIKYIDTNFCIENRRDLKEVVNILQNGSDSQ